MSLCNSDMILSSKIGKREMVSRTQQYRALEEKKKFLQNEVKNNGYRLIHH